MYRKRAENLALVSQRLMKQAAVVAANGSPADMYEFLEVTVESLNKLLYSFNVDDDLLQEIESSLTKRVKDLRPNAPEIIETFFFNKNVILPKFAKSVQSWLNHTK